MGFFGILQVVFIVLKVTDYIDWSWFAVFTPFYIWLSIYILLITVVVPWLDRVNPTWRIGK